MLRSGRYEETLEFIAAVQDTIQHARRAAEFGRFSAPALIGLNNFEAARAVLDERRAYAVDRASQQAKVVAVGLEARLALAENRVQEAIEASLEYKRIGGWSHRWDELDGRERYERLQASGI